MVYTMHNVDGMDWIRPDWQQLGGYFRASGFRAGIPIIERQTRHQLSPGERHPQNAAQSCSPVAPQLPPPSMAPLLCIRATEDLKQPARYDLRDLGLEPPVVVRCTFQNESVTPGAGCCLGSQ